MPKSGRELDAERLAEAQTARDWDTAHRTDLPEPIRTEDSREQVMLGGVRRARLQYLGMWMEGEDDHVVYDERGRFVPLTGRTKVIDVHQLAHNKRIERAFERLTPKQRELLEAHALEGKSLQELRTHGESKQAVSERIAWARNALAKAILATAEEEVVLTGEELG